MARRPWSTVAPQAPPAQLLQATLKHRVRQAPATQLLQSPPQRARQSGTSPSTRAEGPTAFLKSWASKLHGLNGLNGLHGLNGLNGRRGYKDSDGLHGRRGFHGLGCFSGLNGYDGLHGRRGLHGLHSLNGYTASTASR